MIRPRRKILIFSFLLAISILSVPHLNAQSGIVPELSAAERKELEKAAKEAEKRAAKEAKEAEKAAKKAEKQAAKEARKAEDEEAAKLIAEQEEEERSAEEAERALKEAEKAEKQARKEAEKAEREQRFAEYISTMPPSNYVIPEGYGIFSTIASYPELIKLPSFSYDLFPAVNLYLNQSLEGNIGFFSWKFAVDFHINFLGMSGGDDFSARHYNVMCFDFTWNDKKSIHFNIREAWARYRRGYISVTLGSKRVKWGTGNYVSVFDRINPRYIDTRFSHNRNDLWMGNLILDFTVEYPKNIGYFQMLFMPFPTTNQRIDSENKIHVVDPAVSYESFEGGMRFMFNIGQYVSTSLNVLTIMDRDPTDIVGWHHQDDKNIFDPVYGHGRRYIGGLDFRAHRGIFMFNFEAAFVMTDNLFKPYEPSYDYIPITYSSTVEGALEFAFSFAKGKAPTDIVIMANAVYPININLPKPFLFPVVLDPIVGLRFQGQYGNTQKIRGLVRPEIQFLMSISYFDFEATASIGFCFLPTIELRVGGNITGSLDPQYDYRYLGSFYKKGSTGVIDDISNIFIEFKMWY